MANKQAQAQCANKKREFIKVYPEHGTIGATLQAIGIKRRRTFYDWTANDAAFKACYEDELLPNRRDEVASMVYRTATGQLGKHIRTFTNKFGKLIEEEVANEIPSTQLTAAFGFLKATDHVDKDGKDRLVFCEKNQIELNGGGEIILRVKYDG